MDHASWSSVVQALIVAACSWYVRRGSKRDAEVVKSSSAVQVGATQQILDRLGVIEIDVALVKRTLFRETRANVPPQPKGIDDGKSLQP